MGLGNCPPQDVVRVTMIDSPCSPDARSFDAGQIEVIDHLSDLPLPSESHGLSLLRPLVGTSGIFAKQPVAILPWFQGSKLNELELGLRLKAWLESDGSRQPNVVVIPSTHRELFQVLTAIGVRLGHRTLVVCGATESAPGAAQVFLRVGKANRVRKARGLESFSAGESLDAVDVWSPGFGLGEGEGVSGSSLSILLTGLILAQFWSRDLSLSNNEMRSRFLESGTTELGGSRFLKHRILKELTLDLVRICSSSGPKRHNRN